MGSPITRQLDLTAAGSVRLTCSDVLILNAPRAVLFTVSFDGGPEFIVEGGTRLETVEFDSAVVAWSTTSTDGGRLIVCDRMAEVFTPSEFADTVTASGGGGGFNPLDPDQADTLNAAGQFINRTAAPNGISVVTLYTVPSGKYLHLRALSLRPLYNDRQAHLQITDSISGDVFGGWSARAAELTSYVCSVKVPALHLIEAWTSSDPAYVAIHGRLYDV